MSRSSPTGPIVLYIGGYERSGTTLVQNVLGQLDDTFAAGEVRHLWRRALGQDRYCGCGEKVRNCPVWQDVLEQVAGSLGNVDPERLAEHQARFRNRHAPMLFVPFGRRWLGRGLGEYLSLLERMYGAISAETGAKVVIDASKTPVYAYGLSELVGLDVQVLHVVRDPRAVAYSVYKRKQDGHPAYQSHSMLQIGLEWLLVNAATEKLGREGNDRYLRVGYETFAADPATIVQRVCDWLGMEPRGLRLGDDRAVELAPTHTVGGSPHRFETGEIAIRIDDEWKTKLPERKRRLVESVTFPSLRRYGYA